MVKSHGLSRYAVLTQCFFSDDDDDGDGDEIHYHFTFIPFDLKADYTSTILTSIFKKG